MINASAGDSGCQPPRQLTTDACDRRLRPTPAPDACARRLRPKPAPGPCTASASTPRGDGERLLLQLNTTPVSGETPGPRWTGNQSEGCFSHTMVVMLAGGVRVDVLPAGRVGHPTHTHTHTHSRVHRLWGSVGVGSTQWSRVHRWP